VQTAVKALESVKVIQYAESLGGTDSLITYPMPQTHAEIPESERLARGIDGCLLRLPVGLEAADDLIADLEQAMGGEGRGLGRDAPPIFRVRVFSIILFVERIWILRVKFFTPKGEISPYVIVIFTKNHLIAVCKLKCYN